MSAPSLAAQIPFIGFYETQHMEFLDIEEEQARDECEEGSEETIGSRTRDYMEEYAKQYAFNFFQKLKEEYELENEAVYTYDRLVSPREYNFLTDSIHVFLPEVSVYALFLKAMEHYDDFCIYIKSVFTSCDGYASNYDPNLDVWLADGVRSWNEIQLQALLGFLFSEENDELLLDNGSEIASEFITYDGDI